MLAIAHAVLVLIAVDGSGDALADLVVPGTKPELVDVFWRIIDLVVEGRVDSVWTRQSEGGYPISLADVQVRSALFGIWEPSRKLRVRVGGDVVSPGGYWTRPAGVLVPGETEILFLTLNVSKMTHSAIGRDAALMASGDDVYRLRTAEPHWGKKAPSELFLTHLMTRSELLAMIDERLGWRSPQVLIDEADAIVVARVERTERYARSLEDQRLTLLPAEERSSQTLKRYRPNELSFAFEKLAILDVEQVVRGDPETLDSRNLRVWMKDWAEVSIRRTRLGSQSAVDLDTGERAVFLLSRESGAPRLAHGEFSVFRIRDGRIVETGSTVGRFAERKREE